MTYEPEHPFPGLTGIEVNAAGGKQSRIESRITEVPPLALIEVGKVMGEGEKNYPREPDGSPNWHLIDSSSNLDHALEHAANYLAERNKPNRDVAKLREELSHFAARSMMAMEMFLKENNNDNDRK